MVCESCKNNIPETAKFCPRCGAKIEMSETAPAEGGQETAVAATAATPVVAASSESAASAAGAEATAAGGSAPVEPAAVSPELLKDEKIGVADKPKSGSPALLIIILLVLFVAAAAGGYYYYTKYMKKDQPQTQTPAGAPGQAQVPGVPAGQAQPGATTDPSTSQPQLPASAVPSTQPQQPSAQPDSPAGPSAQQPQMPPPKDQYQPQPQMRTRVAIRASALASDFRNGRPMGFSSNFRFGSSRVVHYVQYDKASVGQTSLSSQFYQNGAMLFKCGPSPLQYKSGKYFCRAAQNLNPGEYEVKFIVDGNEEQILKFRVDY
jgi:hypothetical protein